MGLDSLAANTAAFRKLREILDAAGFPSGLTHTQCGAHILQILVRTVLAIPIVAAVVSCIHDLVMYINTAASSDRLGKFEDVAKSMIPPDMRDQIKRLLRRPPVAGQTRWCGTKAELEFTVKHYELLVRFHARFGPTGACRIPSMVPCPPIPTREELHLITFILHILSPFEVGTKSLQLPHAAPMALEAYMMVFGHLLWGFGLKNAVGAVVYDPRNDPVVAACVDQLAEESSQHAADAARGNPLGSRLNASDLHELDIGPKMDDDDDEDAPILDLVMSPQPNIATRLVTEPPVLPLTEIFNFCGNDYRATFGHSWAFWRSFALASPD